MVTMSALPNPYTSAIGPLVTGRDVELAALDVMRKWVSTYLAEAERQTGRTVGSLPRPRSWGTSPDFETWPEDQLPRVLLVSPGLAEPPLADGAGEARARFLLGVACVVSTSQMDETRDLAALYCAVLRTILYQHQSLDGFASGVVWLDENYDDLPSIDDRSLGAGQAIFTVEIPGFARRYNGPPYPDGQVPEPPTDPVPEDPTATDVAATTIKRGV